MLLQMLKERAELLAKETGTSEQNIVVRIETLPEPSTAGKEKAVPFLHLLKPLKRNSNATLTFIQESLVAAEFTFDLFTPVEKTSTGKNPQGLNGQIAAMIDFFSTELLCNMSK